MNDDSHVNAEKNLPPLNVLVSRITFALRIDQFDYFIGKSNSRQYDSSRVFEYSMDDDRKLIIIIYKIRFQSEY